MFAQKFKKNEFARNSFLQAADVERWMELRNVKPVGFLHTLPWP